MPSKWLMQKYPPLAKADGSPGPTSYHRVFDAFYRGAFEAGRQTRILHARQLHDARGEREGIAPELAARRHPVLVVPALYLADDSLLDWFAAYAEAGGHLVLGPRTGYADHEARARHETAPPRLTAAAGARYDEFSNLPSDLPVRTIPDSPLKLLGRRHRDPLGGGPHRHRRHGARRVRPPALRALGGGHDPGPRHRPGDVRRHRPRTWPGAGAHRLALLGSCERLARPARLRHREHRNVPGRAPGPRGPQLELAARRGPGPGGPDRRTGRYRGARPAGRSPWGPGTYGSS